MLKSTIFQSILFSLTIHLIIFFIYFKLVFNLFQPKTNLDFGFHDSYFVVYQGIFENSPLVAIVLGLTITFVVIAIFYIIVKWLCNLIFRLLS